MPFPNLIIAGVPKAGTSSLFNWLSDHPEAWGSRIKETFYLMDRDHPLLRRETNYHDHGMEGYQAFFPHCATNHKIVFEATTHYVYQETALDVLSRMTTPPRIVFLLRKPSQRVYSSYRYTRNNLVGFQRDVSFAEFLRMVKEDSEDVFANRFHERASAHVLKRDIKYSQYVDYIPKWRSRLGQENVHVVLFEDMKRDPSLFMQALARRIGIDPAFYGEYDFARKNGTISVRFRFAHRQVRRIADLIPRGKLREHLKGIYLATCTRKGISLEEEDRSCLRRLDEYFRPFNRGLVNEIDVDLSAWD